MRGFQAVCFILFAFFLVNAQTSKKTKIREPFRQETVARSGWTSPVFAKGVSEVQDETVEIIEDVEIQIKLHKLEKEQQVFIETCDADYDNKAIVDNKRNNYAVGNFVTYETEGKIFAYHVNFIGLIVGENYMAYAGCLGQMLYVDEDGDGRFEARCDGTKLKSLPQWVKDLKQNKLKTKTVK